MSNAKPQPDDSTRTIMIVYGLLANGRPFWSYVAIKPSRYETFIETYKKGALNMNAFGDYGEIIVSGEGKTPPDDVTIKVAALYQTDPANLKQPTDIKQ